MVSYGKKGRWLNRLCVCLVLRMASCEQLMSRALEMGKISRN